MNPRTTAILALCVAALAAFVWFYEIQGEADRVEAEAAGKRLFAVEADAIRAIELETSDGVRARAEREEGVWSLVVPLVFPGDGANLDAMASALADLGHEASYDEPGPPSEYGLPAEPTIRFETADGEFGLRLGDDSPVGGNRYVATEADVPVYAVTRFKTTAFERSLLDLREKQLLDFERDAVREIELRFGETRVLLVKDADEAGTWHVAAPIATDADEERVLGLLSDLEFLRASGFVDAPEGDHGLGSPEFHALLRDAEGEDLAELEIGAAEGEVRHARTPERETLYVLPAERLDDFPRSVEAYRSKRLASFGQDAAQRLEVVFHAEGQTVELAVGRTDDGWERLAEDVAPEVPGDWIEALAALDASGIAADGFGEDELVALGLSPAHVGFRVYGETPEDGEAPLLAEVLLGAPDETRGVPARRGDRRTVFWLGNDAADVLPRSLDDYRERFVVVAEETAPDEASAGEEEATGGVE